MSTKPIHGHFWFDLNKGESINASDGSSYHIQHVVRNPQKFGFKDPSEMQQHAKYEIGDIEKGYRDIDHDLEHHVMQKGFVRGYSHTGPRAEQGYIHFDTDSDENLGKALTHFLPHMEEAEAQGRSMDIEASVGHKDKWNHLKQHYFRDAASVKAHLGKLAPKGLQSKEPQTFQGVGQVTEPVRKKIKDALKQKDPSAPNWKLERDVGYSTGTWGDSVEYKTYKQLFKEKLAEAMSGSAELRKASQRSTQANIKRAGGDAALRGTVAAKAGLKGSQLSQLEKQAGKGKISASAAQKIAQTVLKGK
jgi:hypothetical protein